MNNIIDKKVRITEQSVEYRKAFKWHSLPYTEIMQAYMRIEEANSKVCCGTANFDMHFLMLKTHSDELLKIPVSSRVLTERMLESLHTINPEIKIGYKKNADKKD